MGCRIEYRAVHYWVHSSSSPYAPNRQTNERENSNLVNVLWLFFTQNFALGWGWEKWKNIIFITNFFSRWKYGAVQNLNLSCGQHNSQHTSWENLLFVHRPIQKLISITATNHLKFYGFVELFKFAWSVEAISKAETCNKYLRARGLSVDSSGQVLSSDLSSQSSIWSQRFESGMHRLVSQLYSPGPHSEGKNNSVSNRLELNWFMCWVISWGYFTQKVTFDLLFLQLWIYIFHSTNERL